MKATVSKFFAVLFGFTILLPVLCVAQPPREFTADIPFAFVAADQSLPAGVYRVQPMWRGGWHLKSTKAGVYVGATIPLDDQTVELPMLVFNRIGDEYFLNEIHAVGNWKLLLSKREIQLGKRERPTLREVALR